MKYGQIRLNILKVAQKYPYGFTSNQLIDDCLKEGLSFDKKQILDFLYKSNHVIYDKKRKLFNVIVIGQVNEQIKKAEDLKKITQQFFEKEVGMVVKEVTKEAYKQAQQGLNFYEFSLTKYNNLDKVKEKIIELGYQVENTSETLKIIW